MKCQNCNSMEEHEEMGNTVCAGCGRVKSSAAIVSDLTFDNQVATGKFGNKGGDYSHIRSIWNTNRDTDEYRLATAYKIIADIASSLDIPHSVVESSQ
jgi:transcription initiation factor TFIIIB Brf1 subunit/transcription initiation factor TFIIB